MEIEKAIHLARENLLTKSENDTLLILVRNGVATDIAFFVCESAKILLQDSRRRLVSNY